MLSVRCPTCQTALGLADEMLGQTVRCGSCQEVFIAEPPPTPAPRPQRRYEDEDEEPRRKRRSRRDDDDDYYEDRPSSRRVSRRDEDDDYDLPRRKSRRKRRPKRRATGRPGLATAAAILWMIWGSIGGLLTIWCIIGIFHAMDLGATAIFLLSAIFQTLCLGSVSYYLGYSGLEVLNGQADNTSTKGFTLLIITAILLMISVFRAAYYTMEGGVGPGFQLTIMATTCGVFLVLSSGIILGCIFALVANRDYERWVHS